MLWINLVTVSVCVAVGVVRREEDVMAMISGTLTDAISGGEPDVGFDTKWFGDNCDFSSKYTDPFVKEEYRLSEDEAVDQTRWTKAEKCEESGDDRKMEREDSASLYDCAKTCSARSKVEVDTAICCEYDASRKECEIRVGSQALQKSKYGTDMKNPKNWFGMRKPKRGRIFFTKGGGKDGEATLTKAEAHREFLKAKEGQDHVRELMTQVNHMSIDGMLDHMLSFYICMRWVPDVEFINLLRFETEHVPVNASTKPHPTSREDLINDYIEFNAMPMRCSDARHVQNLDSIDKLLATMADVNAKLPVAYRFSKTVAEAGIPSGLNHLVTQNQRVEATDAAMRFEKPKSEEDPLEDSEFVQDMNHAAKAALPWSGYVRPSDSMERHISKPENLFLLCFGPRVASFPHKREGGQHFLADMNMAGCNGFWSLEKMEELMKSVKKLFAPEMCFEHELRKQLKTQFLRTFVRMNEQFEVAITGRFAKNLNELDPTGSGALRALAPRTVNGELSTEDIGWFANRVYANKYQRVGNFIAKAHSKWTVCDAKPELLETAIGAEDNFFRDPAAYEKWIGEVDDATEPECKTMEDDTGCAICVILVKSEYNCKLRLDVQVKNIRKAIQERTYSFLQSKYTEVEYHADPKNATRMKPVVAHKTGSCMVRKDNGARQTRYIKLAEEFSKSSKTDAEKKAALLRLKDDFLHISNEDDISVVDIKLVSMTGTDLTVESKPRSGYNIEDRKKKVAAFRAKDAAEEASQAIQAIDEDFQILIQELVEEEKVYKDEDFKKDFVFTEKIASMGDNRPEHQVDYFVSCPCDKTDMSPIRHFKTFGSQAMSDYYNF